MAEENENNEEQAEEAAPEQDAPEAPAEEPAAEEPEAQEPPAEDAPAEEETPAEEEAPAEEPAAEQEPAAAAAPAEDAEPEERLGPKELRRRARSQFTGEPGPQLSPDERAERRSTDRGAKAADRRRYRHGRGKNDGSGTGTPPADRVEGTKKVRQGIVTSNKADKTITVAVQSARRHPSYEKIIRRSNTLHAHDERNEAGEGDTVRVIETRPMSRTKRWRLVEVVEKAK